MKITEKLSYSEYFNDARFKCKIPTDETSITQAGDNIYKPSKDIEDEFIQLPNRYHFRRDKKRDLSGRNVLISNEFFYFGKGAIQIKEFKKIKIPKFQSAHGVNTTDTDEINRLWEY